MIFAFWNTENVPMFQMRCLDNWRRFNPTWTLRLLSVATAPSIVGASNLPPTWLKMAPQLQSDAVRLAALKMFGGVWVDITTLFTRQNALDTMWDEMVAAGKSMRAFVWNDVGPHLVDSYFIMAQKSSSLIAQWHGIFLTYWQTRTVASGIRNHNLFSMLSRWPEMQGMIARGKLRVEYWSIHVCFLRVQALYEDAQHLSWMDHAYLQNSNETSYYHIDQLCKYHHNNNKKLICMRDQMLRTDLPLSSIALHTPLLKFHGGMVRALDLGTDAKFIRCVLDECGTAPPESSDPHGLRSTHRPRSLCSDLMRARHPIMYVLSGSTTETGRRYSHSCLPEQRTRHLRRHHSTHRYRPSSIHRNSTHRHATHKYCETHTCVNCEITRCWDGAYLALRDRQSASSTQIEEVRDSECSTQRQSVREEHSVIDHVRMHLGCTQWSAGCTQWVTGTQWSPGCTQSGHRDASEPMECFGASVGHATQDYNTGFGRRAVVRVGALVGSGWLHGMVVRFRL